MKARLGVWGLAVGLGAVAAQGQTELEITSIQGNGTLTWTYPTNVGTTSFRVEWAPQAAGPWSAFSNAAAQLDTLAPTGTAMSVAVPMLYRVLAAEPTINPVVTFIVDDYEEDAPGDILNVFRTPALGPAASVAWYEGHGARTAVVTNGLDGQAARLTVPAGAALDYVAYLGAVVGPAAYLLTWDMEIAETNGGGGMFFVRFSRADGNGMQVLFGFLDDGRIIRFFDEPSYETYVEVGTFAAGTRYRTHFIYDLAAATFSVLFDGKWIVDHAAVPALFKLDGIGQFGFDVNQTLGLPDQPALGNAYWVDNVRFGPLNGPH